MESDSDVPNWGRQCIKVGKKFKTTIKLEGLSWKNSKERFGLIWKIEIWSH
ncbi:hypothetical protein CACET_c30890 [Clostridium aceticum]|uniref:Uncharacterized protein n=1 Tax=Clostridium aceticum TaxID=84022 RepID=A0A0G3WDV3_9CLOT|nr:hypothetical protein [Clostridium aceticum]AKL96533.1 hypothetical protein CACET_c30890 [Clostridium aceticum]